MAAKADLARLVKLLALSEPPASGSDEEAKRASLAVCAMIREHNLAVIDPRDQPVQPLRDETFQERYARVVDANPVRAALRKRKLDREAHAAERIRKAKFVVGEGPVL